jgi:hypothetical protein
MSIPQITAASETIPGNDACPPTGSGCPAPRSDVAASLPYLPLRPTVHQRPTIAPSPWLDPISELGYTTDHPYVRRFWTSVIGPGAVADLLRLAVAARRDRSLPRPVHLHLLIREGLARCTGGILFVRPTVPPLSAQHVLRLPPALRREHARYRFAGPP